MAAPPLRITRRFTERGRHVVELLRPSGLRVWCYGATADEAEGRAVAEVHAADKKARAG